MKLNRFEINHTEVDQQLQELENIWKKSQHLYTDRELLTIFPEAISVIHKKISERTKERKELVNSIREKLSLIKNKTGDEFTRWFRREWVKLNEGRQLLETDSHLARLYRLLRAGNIHQTENSKGVSEDQIHQAQSYPIEQLASLKVKLRKSGKNYVGLCPFHPDKNPSLFIYPNTNSFYCFACLKGGDAISFVMLLENLKFPEAVKRLTGER